MRFHLCEIVLLVDVEKAFLQIGTQKQKRDVIFFCGSEMHAYLMVSDLNSILWNSCWLNL